MAFNETMGILKLREALAGAVYNSTLKPTPETLRGLPHDVAGLPDTPAANYMRKELSRRRGAAQEMADEAAFWCALALGAVDALIQNTDDAGLRLSHAGNLLRHEYERRHAAGDADLIGTCLDSLSDAVAACTDQRGIRLSPHVRTVVLDAFAAASDVPGDRFMAVMAQEIAKSTGIRDGALSGPLTDLENARLSALRSCEGDVSGDAEAYLDGMKAMAAAQWAPEE